MQGLGDFGRLWLQHNMSHRGSRRLWKILGASGRLWEGLGGSGRLCKALVCFGRHGKAWEGFGRLLGALECFGRVAASVRLSKALVQWMLWKVLEALGVFGRYGRLWEAFRKLWDALGSFDVNMVCPSPGSWISYVLHTLHICMWFCAYVLQSVGGSSWVELIF